MGIEGLPGVVEAVVGGQVDFGLKQVAEVRGGKEFGFGTVGVDAAGTHHEDAIDFGDDIGDVVRDKENAGSLLGELAKKVAEVALGGEVEGVGGFVEEEHSG